MLEEGAFIDLSGVTVFRLIEWSRKREPRQESDQVVDIDQPSCKKKTLQVGFFDLKTTHPVKNTPSDGGGTTQLAKPDPDKVGEESGPLKKQEENEKSVRFADKTGGKNNLFIASK